LAPLGAALPEHSRWSGRAPGRLARRGCGSFDALSVAGPGLIDISDAKLNPDPAQSGKRFDVAVHAKAGALRARRAALLSAGPPLGAPRALSQP
jgi:hypothetical protein